MRGWMIYGAAALAVAAGLALTLIPLGGESAPPTSEGVVITTTVPPSTSTTVTVLPPPVTSPATRSGIFVSGWNTCGQAAGVYYGQTFVSPLAAEGVLTHRINQIRCDDNVPFVYLEIVAHPTEITAGTFDEFILEWFAEYFAVCGTDCILAPLAEMNGPWVPWYTENPAEYVAAYNHLQALALPLGATQWAYAPSQHLGWKDYAPPVYDLLTPSIFDGEGLLNPLDIIGRAKAMRAHFGKRVIIGQTSTIRSDKDEWLRELFRLASRDGILGVIMFDFEGQSAKVYEYPGGLMNSVVFQQILETTDNGP